MILRLRRLFLFLLVIQVYASGAQESMMPSVSYPYLEKLIAVAKLNYPKMKMYDHKVIQAKSSIEKAQLGWFNILNFTYLYSPNNSSTALVNPSLLDGYQFGVYLNVGTILGNGPSVRMAREDYNIALDNLAEYNLNIEAEVKQRYFNYVRQLAVLSVRTKNAEDVQGSLDQIKHKFEKGEESLDNYNKGLTFYANAIQVKIESEGDVLVAKSALEELLGEKLEEVK